MKRAITSILVIALALVLVVGAFVSGVMFDRAIPNWMALLGMEVPTSSLTEKISEVERMIDDRALEEASEESKTAGALQGLLDGTGDPYAAYFDAESYDYFNEQTNGEFRGIGVTISESDGVVSIVSVFEDTPAEEAGLEPEDQIVRVDDVTQDVWTLDEAVTRIRGPEGTTVELEVYRPADDENVSFVIERAKIDIPNVMARMEGDDVGYIRVMSFNGVTAEDMDAEIDNLEAEGAEGFVIDMRDNPGGLLQEAVDVSSLFVKEGVIVRVDERDRDQIEHYATGQHATDKPLVVLVNENSASASEVFAGALQDYSRATIVGQTTFGKGSVQTVEPLSFGGGVKFTIAHYLTPLERVIDGVGVTPDEVVEMDPELQAEEDSDTQLQMALELVRAEI
jgi:carboxyl-terminal processing protease